MLTFWLIIIIIIAYKYKQPPLIVVTLLILNKNFFQKRYSVTHGFEYFTLACGFKQIREKGQ
jgi:hypothetical protein